MRKLIVLLLVLVMVFPAYAQDEGTVIADGLNSPRGLFYDSDGVLYIAEAGMAGDIPAETESGTIMSGATSRILTVDNDGDVEVLVSALPSTVYFQDYVGAHDVYVSDDMIWVLTGLGPLSLPHNMALIGLDRDNLRVTEFVDLYSFEVENNPDNDVRDSNPTGFAVTDDGTVYIIDASGNTLLRWTSEGGVELVHVWEDLSVPTAVDIDGEGNLYVSFLSSFPFTTGSARIEKLSPDGEVLETYGGLTGATDVMVGDDGTIYAVELASEFGDLGWTPDTGRVVTVSADGVTPVIEGLNLPYRVVQAPNGSLAVTVNSAYSEPGTGQVLRFGGM